MPAPRTFDRAKVASVLLHALSIGLPANATVMALLDVSANQARYMIRTVRQAGYLGRPPHLPTRAIVHPHSATPRSWLVCSECLSAWPCDYSPRTITQKPR